MIDWGDNLKDKQSYEKIWPLFSAMFKFNLFVYVQKVIFLLTSYELIF